MGPESIQLLRITNLTRNLELKKKRLERKNTSFTLFVERYWISVEPVRKMELKSFNMITVEARINFGISVTLKTSPLHLLKLNDK